MTTLFTVEQEQSMVTRYLNGESQKKIGDDFGIHRRVVGRVLDKHQIQRLGSKNAPPKKRLIDPRPNATKPAGSMTFSEACVTPFIRRRSWPEGEVAEAKWFKDGLKKGDWYWERRYPKHSTFFAVNQVVDGNDWERCTAEGKTKR